MQAEPPPWDDLSLTPFRLSSLVVFSRYSFRGIASLLNANEVGMKIFEDYANSWDWILV